ncbi:MAG: hypothetical protein MZV49_00290 [Rhodopseudomonas palustris]|nr:hypothetical protein [Rhodopseudomonas palustris]
MYSAHFGDTPFYVHPQSRGAGERAERRAGRLADAARLLREPVRGRRGDAGQSGAALESLRLRRSCSQHFKPMLVPFVDIGRVFDKVGSVQPGRLEGRPAGWAFESRGISPRSSASSTGWAARGVSFYMEIGHQF